MTIQGGVSDAVYADADHDHSAGPPGRIRADDVGEGLDLPPPSGREVRTSRTRERHAVPEVHLGGSASGTPHEAMKDRVSMTGAPGAPLTEIHFSAPEPGENLGPLERVRVVGDPAPSRRREPDAVMVGMAVRVAPQASPNTDSVAVGRNAARGTRPNPLLRRCGARATWLLCERCGGFSRGGADLTFPPVLQAPDSPEFT
jgi:hypothetical protein